MATPANPLSEAAHAEKATPRALDTGGPAFPVRGFDDPNIQISAEGMTLRDYFAAQALCVLANGEWRPSTGAEMRHLAARLYQMADAMIAARAVR